MGDGCKKRKRGETDKVKRKNCFTAAADEQNRTIPRGEKESRGSAQKKGKDINLFKYKQ